MRIHFHSDKNTLDDRISNTMHVSIEIIVFFWNYQDSHDIIIHIFNQCSVLPFQFGIVVQHHIGAPHRIHEECRDCTGCPFDMVIFRSLYTSLDSCYSHFGLSTHNWH